MLDVSSNQDNLDFTEIQSCEPVEYTDKYVPWKYGIIFKEKVYVQPVDHTVVSLNIRLLKNKVDFGSDNNLLKRFVFQVLDNGHPIFTKTGYNQINLSHFLFRSNHGLLDGPSQNGEEVKHNYVI